jgi:protein-tyrosine phosphatase
MEEEEEEPEPMLEEVEETSPRSKPPPISISKRSLLVIRAASSTPNLQAAFSSFSPVQTSLKRKVGSPEATLAAGEINRRFPLNARTGCPPLEYIKLPWNHDQSDLVVQFPRIFSFLDRVRSNGGRTLVHCQCGVSRSASAVIGYVMACSRSRPDASLPANLGMHDAYAYVKERSSWISPNIGLVYQLVEWEKKLRGETPLSELEEDIAMRSRDDYGDKSPSSSGTDSFSDHLSTPGDSFHGPPLTVMVDGMLSRELLALTLGTQS